MHVVVDSGFVVVFLHILKDHNSFMNFVKIYKHLSRFYITSLNKKLKEEGFYFMGVLYMLISYLNGMYSFYTNLKVVVHLLTFY